MSDKSERTRPEPLQTAVDFANNILREPSRGDLQGKFVVGTGCMNGIGARAILDAGYAGARIGTISTRPEKYPDFTEAAGLLGLTEGQSPVVAKGDLKNPDDRKRFCDEMLKASGGKIDVLYLNASGEGPAVNIEANTDLVTQLKPHMTRRAKVVLAQSVARWYPKYAERKAGHHYVDNIAPHKWEGQKRLSELLRKTHPDDPDLYIEVGGVEPNSRNVRFFRVKEKRDARERAETDQPAKGLDDLQAGVSIPLGLDTYFTADQMGRRVYELMASNLPHGFIDLMKEGVYDVPTMLESLAHGVLVDTIQLTGEGQAVARLLTPSGRFDYNKAFKAAWEAIMATTYTPDYLAQSARVAFSQPDTTRFQADGNMVQADAYKIFTAVQQDGNQYHANAAIAPTQINDQGELVTGDACLTFSNIGFTVNRRAA